MMSRIKSGKYDKQVSLQCPICGSQQFEHDGNIENENTNLKCHGCGRNMRKDDLIQENSENINEYVNDLKKEVLKDVKAELSASLKKACSGNKHIKFK